MSSGMWIVLVSVVLLVAAAIVVGQLFHRLQKRCPTCGRFNGKESGRQLIPGTLKRRLRARGEEATLVPYIKAKHIVSYTCLTCGYRWTKVKVVSHDSL